jgi:hypothetical protein
LGGKPLLALAVALCVGAALASGCGRSEPERACRCPDGGHCVNGVCLAASCGDGGPRVERCNGEGDDCNGLVDEGDPGGGGRCATGLPGPCAEGVEHCQGGGLACVAAAAHEEVCNGQDDDCNGVVDDPSALNGRPCDTGKAGVCAAGLTWCAAGHLLCTQVQQPRPEVCGNQLDDDCNGEVDEGAACSGCADGTREGFAERRHYPQIAGCAGGFTRPGVLDLSGPFCGRHAGNDSSNPDGAGCNAEDLCAAGWHLCGSAAEVASHSPDGCAGVPGSPPLFFVTRQSGPGCWVCATGESTDPNQCSGDTCQRGCRQTLVTANDLFGCGNVGGTPDPDSCGVLDRASNNVCSELPAPWSCGPDGTREAHQVVKPGPAVGGALCCKD